VSIERIGGFETPGGARAALHVIDNLAYLEFDGPHEEYHDHRLTADNLKRLEALCRRARRRELKE
jgi:hypothetical protein